MSVELAPRGARTKFTFDLGAVLETHPYDRISEQWILFTPENKVLTLRADGRYAFMAGDVPVTRKKWRAA